MTIVKVGFNGIVELRKFENALNFVGITHEIDLEVLEIRIDRSDMDKRPDLKIEISTNSTSICFKSKP